MNVNAQIAFNKQELVNIHQRLSETYFSPQSLSVSYRILNHWDKTELLILNRKGQKGWRKFNWFESVWIELIANYRQWGLSLEKIKQIKTDLLLLKTDIDFTPYRLIEICLILAVLEIDDFYLTTNKNGNTQIINIDQLNNEEAFSDSLLLLYLNPIAMKWQQQQPITINESKVYNLNPKETELIHWVSQNLYQRVMVFYENRSTITIDNYKNPQAKEDLMDLLKNSPYQKIFLFKLDGSMLQVFAENK